MYALLKGMHRIQASTGLPQRSRSPCHISGLKFDYFDKWNLTIVGQWMDEFDSFELTKDESIKGITIWMSKEGYSSQMAELARGKVVAIRVDTSRHRSKMFKLSLSDVALDNCMLHQYQPNPQEDMVSQSYWSLGP